MERDVGLERVFVIAGLDSLLREEFVGHAGEFRLGKFQLRVRLGDVVLEIRFQRGQFLAEFFHLVALGFRQFQPGAAIVAQRVVEQLFVLARQIRLRGGKGFQRAVNVLAIVNAHGPFGKPLHGVGGCVAHVGVGAGLLNETEPIGGAPDFKIQIVQRDEGVGEIDLRRRKYADGVKRGVTTGDGFGNGGGDFIRARLEHRQRDDGIELGGGRLKIRERSRFAGGGINKRGH